MTTQTAVRLPSAAAYTTQHAVGGPVEQRVLDAALQTVYRINRLGAPDHLVALIDYLADRVEGHTVESFAALIGDGPECALDEVAQARIETHAYAVRTEAARTVLVALGIPTGNLAPIDYPTVTRYWLACRNAVRAAL